MLRVISIFAFAAFLVACSSPTVSVAAYLCKFEKLPSNYRTKAEAEALYRASGKTFSKWNFNPWETLGISRFYPVRNL